MGDAELIRAARRDPAAFCSLDERQRRRPRGRRARVETAARRRLGMPRRDYGGFDEVEDREDALAAPPALAATLAGFPPASRPRASGSRGRCGRSGLRLKGAER